MLPRRAALATCAACFALPARAADIEWDAFKARFLRPDGRIVDSGNKDVSHTEGQGWGMLFAEHFADAAAFASIWNWTRATLRRPHDALHSWRYAPGAVPAVTDPNNATDGDLFIGAALSRAARRWNQPAYAKAATVIGQDVLRLLVRKVGARTVLLPGAAGFETPAEVVLNPSYYAFPALRELAGRVRSPLWDDVERDGVALLAAARFGRWRLPPDWLRLDRMTGALSPAPAWPPRFSYDAIRVPLYLAWSRLLAPGDFRAFFDLNGGHPPAWADLATDAEAPYPAPPGMTAVAMLVTGGQDLPAGFPSIAQAPDYYSAALILLARIAWQESRSA